LKVLAKIVTLPICVFDSSDNHGQDCSAYVCTADDFVASCKEVGWELEDVITVIADDGNYVAMQILIADMADIFDATSSEEEFRSRCHDCINSAHATKQLSPLGEGTSVGIDSPTESISLMVQQAIYHIETQAQAPSGTKYFKPIFQAPASYSVRMLAKQEGDKSTANSRATASQFTAPSQHADSEVEEGFKK
jgi:hypothetical protein